ncbi:hypothetical protein D9M72_463080 [compost metagenome]
MKFNVPIPPATGVVLVRIPVLKAIASPVRSWSFLESVADHVKPLSPVQVLDVYVLEAVPKFENVSFPPIHGAAVVVKVSSIEASV